MKFSGKACNVPLNNWLNFGGDPNHCLDTGIVFRIRHYWQIRKMIPTVCAARRCSAEHGLSRIAIATMTPLRHRPLAEVCTVAVLLVLYLIFCLIYLPLAGDKDYQKPS